MSQLKLMETEGSGKAPGCLLQRAEDREAYAVSYRAAHTATDVLKEELLHRLNRKLFPKDEDFAKEGWETIQAKNLGYIKALKEVIELLP